MKHAQPYRGVFPWRPPYSMPTAALDLDGQRRCIDFMIDAGSDGLCILANFSEQFVLSDAERETVMHAVLDHVAGRVPVIVTTTHFSSALCAERSRQRAGCGRRHGDDHAALSRRHHPRAGSRRSTNSSRRVSDAIRIPIMIQDAPVAGTPLSAPFLARMAREIENVSYFKIETAQAAAKLRELIALGRRCHRGSVGWRRGHHADGRSGCRRHRRHDRRRLSRRHPQDRRSPIWPADATRRPSAYDALAAADQLRKPPMRLAGGQDADGGGRRDHIATPCAIRSQPLHPAIRAGPDRNRAASGSAGPALGKITPAC